jgi:hypothetical protein
MVRDPLIDLVAEVDGEIVSRISHSTHCVARVEDDLSEALATDVMDVYVNNSSSTAVPLAGAAVDTG